ncbi:MAG: MerR family transcriptional regulator [Ktedonobacterales bacterium]
MISHDQHLEASEGSGHHHEDGGAAANVAGAMAATQPSDGYLRIEQVSARTGLTKRTLRYYEEIGLLAPPTRTEGGYRLYSQDDIEHLERIKRLKDLLGFSLAEIREIAEAEEEREHVRTAWRQATDPHAKLAWLEKSEELTLRQLRMVEEKLAGLNEMRDNLVGRQERYEQLRAELLTQIDEGKANG